jgi:hypothetical protein
VPPCWTHVIPPYVSKICARVIGVDPVFDTVTPPPPFTENTAPTAKLVDTWLMVTWTLRLRTHRSEGVDSVTLKAALVES